MGPLPDSRTAAKISLFDHLVGGYERTMDAMTV
jgi:hypothetical protein